MTHHHQRNNWYIDMLKDELERQGFMVKHHFTHTRFLFLGSQGLISIFIQGTQERNEKCHSACRNGTI